MARRSSYYDILGVEPLSSIPEIRESYRRLVRSCFAKMRLSPHTAGQALTQINQAYNVLTDPERRRYYDAALLHAYDVKPRMPEHDAIAAEDAPAPPQRDLGKPIADTLIREAYAAYLIGDPSTAADLCQEVLLHAPNRRSAWLLLGHIYCDRGQVDRALAAYFAAEKGAPTSLAAPVASDTPA